MKKSIAVAFIVFGLLFPLAPFANHKPVLDGSFLIGTYLPGLICLAIGAQLRRERRSASVRLVSLGGLILVVWGTAHYMMRKGYVAWFGLSGLLLLPGLVMLVYFPNKTKNNEGLSANDVKDTRSVGVEALVFLLLLVLPVAAFLTLRFFIWPHNIDHPANVVWTTIDPTNVVWTTVATDPMKFTVQMPGNPQRQVYPLASPTNSLQKFTTYKYKSGDGIAVYTATFIPMPPWSAGTQDPVAINHSLDSAANATVSEFKGRLIYRKSISCGKYVGCEQAMEFAAHRAGKPLTAMAISQSYYIRGSIVVLGVNMDKNDRNRPGMDSRIARFFNSLKPTE
jgi:hypothetical protein